MKRQIKPLVGDHIRLRLIEEADLPMTLAWRNQDHIRKWFIHSDTLTMEQHTNWFHKYQERENDFLFIIEAKHLNNKPVGQISLYSIDWEKKEAEFGRLMIGEADAIGKGLARTATALLVNFGIQELGLERIYLEVYENNASAIAIYEKCGFEAISRHNHLIAMQIKCAVA